MTAAVVWGVVAGAVTFGISELLLKLWGKRPAWDFWKVSLAGVIARSAYVLGILPLRFQAATAAGPLAFIRKPRPRKILHRDTGTADRKSNPKFRLVVGKLLDGGDP